MSRSGQVHLFVVVLVGEIIKLPGKENGLEVWRFRGDNVRHYPDLVGIPCDKQNPSSTASQDRDLQSLHDHIPLTRSKMFKR